MSKLSIEGHGFSRTITLNDGHRIPLFGLGLYKCEPVEAANITADSLHKGYRLLDTAVAYGYYNTFNTFRALIHFTITCFHDAES